MEYLISIIVPVYNAAPYLNKCLDSIIGQTYEKLQIICINDGSADNSPRILDEYACKEDRIVVLHKENEGVSLARNTALEKATGDCIMFVDGDDWIEPDTCAVAVEVMQQHNVDVVMWSYVRELTNESRKKNILDTDTCFEQSAVKEKLYRRMIGLYGEETAHPENADALCTVWGKLYKRELIEKNGIRFFDIRKIGTYEDGLFNLDVFAKTNRAVFINRHLYHYRKDNSTSITSAYNAGLSEQWDVLFDILLDHIDDNDLDDSFRIALNNRIVFSLIALGLNETEKHDDSRNIICRIDRIIQAERYKKAIAHFDAHYLPIYWRLFFSCAKHGCAVGVYLLLLVIQKIRGK